MDNAEFRQLADQLILHVEQKLDSIEGDADIDCENDGSTMTLTFKSDKQNKIVITRHEDTRQIGLATKTNSYHFDYTNGSWIDARSKKSFLTLLSEAATVQAGQEINFN
ncbi:iron donor protein CyaY [Kitasatospora sp. NBC_01287]|uniref:iron donor protein CyaY n=1 Tax=Kitasatospora sp. NBC_01287 TaxID=2903573 RepID=UPI00224FA459|nr:iron donor protein CyaY [Kitasatospora sp. NBC_01287]MCX4751198.1 iron donor protein CyaY [Kitasatospora sp. NBC_01287]